jgi:hypothetical protein
MSNSEIHAAIMEIDQLLFDAGVLALKSRTAADRIVTDLRISDARVKLERLRQRIPA